MPPIGDDDVTLKEKLIESLRHECGGTTLRIYVPLRPRREIDWVAVKARRVAGVTVAVLARELQCSERTITRRAPLRDKKEQK
jgi:hypothetical protein